MKARFLLAVLLSALLWFSAGCGSGKKPENTGESASAGSSENTELQIIPGRMELLEFEDGDSENLADLLQKNGSGMMVQLQSGNLLGSGVICGIEEDRLLILTAAHVLAKAEELVRVTFADGGSVYAGDYECFASGDFGTVRVQLGDIPENSLEQCICANINKDSFDAATTGTGCIVMGSRTGVAAEAYEGVILDHWIYMADYGQYMMWVKAEGLPGMSGGGLFDRQGYFLGILSGGNEDGELAVVPLSLILAEIEL
ncbi:MAG: serine protease [Butyrivibrio sp.]|nr:serine protease [Acetatifactor muris]MCM1560004.1 serine protease [Butyrivibrio sp.]